MEATLKNIGRKNIKISVTSSDLKTIQELTKLMPQEVQASFKKRYGSILELLFIQVDTLVLSALSQFWNPSLSCFELPELDTTPTIEEYATMVRLPVREGTNVYSYHGHYISEGKIIDVPISQIGVEERGSIRGIKRGFLETRLRALAHLGNWDLFNLTLALSIYGLILFPFTPNLVDEAAIDVFSKAHQQGQNPIPAILADTFLSLGVCQQNNGGRLRCCSHMLYVWFVTHVYADRRGGSFTNPLTDFHRIIIKQKEVEAWKQEFSEIQVKSFKWVCPWYHGERITYSCGCFKNVPLMGPRGCVSYMPGLVLRQLHFTQTKPHEEHLCGWSFFFQEKNDTRKKEEEIKKAWLNVNIFGKHEFGQQRSTASEEYREWRRERVGQSCIPRDLPKGPMLEKIQTTPKSASQEEILKAHVRFLEEKKEAADVEVIILQNQCQKMAKEIEALKDDYADVVESARLKRGRESNSSIYLARMEELKKRLVNCEEEKHRWKGQAEKEKQALERAEAEINKRDISICNLMKEVEKEKEAKQQLEEELKKEKHMRKKLEEECGRARSSVN